MTRLLQLIRLMELSDIKGQLDLHVYRLAYRLTNK